MAGGDYLVAYDADRLPLGWAVTSSGRLSVAVDPAELPGRYPFPQADLMALDVALTNASRQSKARFAVYVGDLGADPASRAGEVLADVPTPNNAVLLAVSPDQRAIEVVYGSEVAGRGAESVAPLGVSAAASSFREGNRRSGGGTCRPPRNQSAAARPFSLTSHDGYRPTTTVCATSLERRSHTLEIVSKYSLL